ncbi:hypothetical protein ACOJTA_05695 [Malaciobacter sp. WC5094]
MNAKEKVLKYTEDKSKEIFPLLIESFDDECKEYILKDVILILEGKPNDIEYSEKILYNLYCLCRGNRAYNVDNNLKEDFIKKLFLFLKNQIKNEKTEYLHSICSFIDESSYSNGRREIEELLLVSSNDYKEKIIEKNHNDNFSHFDFYKKILVDVNNFNICLFNKINSNYQKNKNMKFLNKFLSDDVPNEILSQIIKNGFPINVSFINRYIKRIEYYGCHRLTYNFDFDINILQLMIEKCKNKNESTIYENIYKKLVIYNNLEELNKFDFSKIDINKNQKISFKYWDYNRSYHFKDLKNYIEKVCSFNMIEILLNNGLEINIESIIKILNRIHSNLTIDNLDFLLNYIELNEDMYEDLDKCYSNLFYKTFEFNQNTSYLILMKIKSAEVRDIIVNKIIDKGYFLVLIRLLKNDYEFSNENIKSIRSHKDRKLYIEFIKNNYSVQFDKIMHYLI